MRCLGRPDRGRMDKMKRHLMASALSLALATGCLHPPPGPPEPVAQPDMGDDAAVAPATHDRWACASNRRADEYCWSRDDVPSDPTRTQFTVRSVTHRHDGSFSNAFYRLDCVARTSQLVALDGHGMQHVVVPAPRGSVLAALMDALCPAGSKP